MADEQYLESMIRRLRTVDINLLSTEALLLVGMQLRQLQQEGQYWSPTAAPWIQNRRFEVEHHLDTRKA